MFRFYFDATEKLFRRLHRNHVDASGRVAPARLNPQISVGRELFDPDGNETAWSQKNGIAYVRSHIVAGMSAGPLSTSVIYEPSKKENCPHSLIAISATRDPTEDEWFALRRQIADAMTVIRVPK